MGRTMRIEEKAATFAVGLLVAAVIATIGFLVSSALRSESGHAATDPIPGSAGTEFVDNPGVHCETPAISWQRSKPIGLPFGGRLIRGVQLPAEGDHFFTWDFGLKPSPGFRRWGVHGTIRLLLQALCDYRLAHPDGPRIGIGDLSRPFGGKFGRRFGGEGHASHQNGLDIDVLYPRFDGQELVARKPHLIDHLLSQELVDAFVAAGAQYVFVGPKTGLVGPKKIVQKLVNHNDHMHIRFPARLVTKIRPPPAPAAAG